MAQKVVHIRISDLSQEELGDAGQTINFSVGSDSYSIDLSDKEAGKFYDALKPYMDAATKTSGRGVRRSSSSRSASGSGRSKEELAEVRAWAQKNGHEVSERGRIAQTIIDAFDSAH